MKTHLGPGSRLIRQRIKKANPDLAHQLDNLWMSAIKKIHEFQEGKTEQGHLHCLRVENNIGLLLQDKITKFKDLDLFALSAAAALHDIGRIKMARVEGEKNLDHGLLADEVLRSEGIWMEFLWDWRKIQAIAHVISVHDNGKIEDLQETDFVIDTPPGLLLRSLAAIFRLADMLDTTYERTPLIMRKLESMKYVESPKVWLARGTIGGWKIKHDGRTITLQASFKSQEEQRAALTCVDLLNESITDSHRRYLENCPVVYWKGGSVRRETVHFPFIFQLEGVEQTSQGDLSRLHQAAMKDYLTHLAWDLSNVNLDGMGEFEDKRPTSLAKVFIDVNARLPIEWRPKEVMFDQWEKRKSPSSPIISQLEKGSVPITKIASNDNIKRLVILGDPGSGKSTIVQFLCLEASRKYVDTGKARLILLRVIVRNYISKKRKMSGDYGITDYINDEVATHLRGRCPRGFVNYCLSQQNCVVIFDGLDEVPQREEREKVRSDVFSFAGRFEKARYIVTSRIVGYEQAALDMNRFLHVKLEPLTKPQISGFIEAWYEERERDPERREIRTDSFMKALENQPVGQLARNPLLLTIMSLVHRAEADLPRQRALLYEKCVEAFLINRDRARGLLSYDEVEIRRCHEYLGFWMHSKGRRKGDQIMVEMAELKAKLAEFMSSYSALPLSLHEKKVDEFIDTARRRVGLIVERSHGVFAFGHRSFQEYFAASFLTSANYGIDQLWASICDRVFEPYWHEVILLLAGRLGFTSHRGLNDLIEKILKTEIKAKSRVLAAEIAIDKAPITGMLLKKITEELITALLYESIPSELFDSEVKKSIRKEQMSTDFVTETDTVLHKYLVLLTGLIDTEVGDYVHERATNIYWTPISEERVSRLKELVDQGLSSFQYAKSLVEAFVKGIEKKLPRYPHISLLHSPLDHTKKEEQQRTPRKSQ